MKRVYKMENPLARYKFQHYHITWKALAEMTGMSEQSLLRLANLDEDKINGIEIGTREKIINTLGIDMLTDWVYNKKK